MIKIQLRSDRHCEASDTKSPNNVGINIKQKGICKKKAKIILLIIGIFVLGAAFGSIIVYFGFFSSSKSNKKENQKGSNSDIYDQKAINISNNKIEYKCKDIIKNCKECDEEKNGIMKSDYNETEKNFNSSIVCTSCDSGFYPIMNKQNKILFCNKKCEIGDLDLCKACDTENQNQCSECNSGFYLPNDEKIKSKCKKCSDLIENCEDCYATINIIKCKLCKDNYILSKEKNSCEKKCQTGENSFCNTCNEENNECETCNPGYYLPFDQNDKSKCKKCSDIVKNCQKCHGGINSVICDDLN